MIRKRQKQTIEEDCPPEGDRSPSDAELDRLIRLLPGYDPVATSGDCLFDYEAARLYIDFIEQCCTYTHGAKTGEPLLLEDWERALVANLFGWKRPDGTRRYREALLFVGRGNGKSELAAAIVCAVIYLDDEPAAQLYGAAAKRDQTHYIFDPVKAMILACPEMRALAEIFKNAIQAKGCTYKCVSRDATTEHGGSTHFAVIDELHAQPDRDLVDVLRTSTIKTTQGLLLYVTTSDFDRPESICNEKHDYACKVRDRVIEDPSFLPAVFEASRDDDWKDPAVWRKANPNLGVSIRESDLGKLCKDAENIPGFLNTFLRLHLNVRTQNDSRWLSLDDWRTSDAAGGDFSESLLDGGECWAGLDLSSTTDLSAFVCAFPAADGLYKLLCRFWCPEENARKREQRDRVPYPQWMREGWITATPGNVIDYDRIRADVLALAERFHIREIAADRWNATQIITQLSGDGLTIFPFGQGYKDMTAPSKELEKLITSGKLAARRNPVLQWMISNVACETDAAGNVKPSKAKSTERIDGVVALVMAIGRAMLRSDGLTSCYESQGLRTI